jgi:uncharacterized small protein (DUF1192 family)
MAQLPRNAACFGPAAEKLCNGTEARYGTGTTLGQDDFMINSDEDLPKPSKKLLVPPPLDMLGIDELNGYILLLQDEISRVKAAISSKDAAKAAAAAFFKMPPG